MPLPTAADLTNSLNTNTQMKQHLGNLADYVAMISDQAKRKSMSFYMLSGEKVIQDSNAELFSVEIDVNPGEIYLVNTNSLIGSVAGRLYVADSSKKSLFLIDSNQIADLPNVVKIPAGGAKLYVNCVYNYADKFSVLKVSKSLFDLFKINQDRQDFSYFYRPNGGQVVKGNHQGLFTVQKNVTPGDVFLLDTKSFGLGAAYYVVDDQDNVLSMIRTDEIPQHPFIVKIPAGASKLYVNCGYDYASKFDLKKISKNLISFIENGGRKEDYSFFYAPDNVNIKREGNQALFSVELAVHADQYYLLDTQGQGVAGEWYATDDNGAIVEKKASNGLANGEQIVKIPAGASKLYVNCVNTYTDKFHIERVPRVLAENIGKRVFVVTETGVFYVVSSGSISGYPHPDFFSSIVSVGAGEKYDIETRTYGIALEYVITDINGLVLESKTSEEAAVKYSVKIPAGGAKLYVNCANEFSTVLKIDFSQESVEPAKQVADYFPSISHFGKLQAKCPNFYTKFKEKNQDVTVVLTGTSLTQGNFEYTSEREDASMRPAALHTHDLASSIFDVLVKHWDGQKYRRYDHDDIFYSNSAWVITSNADDWDDHTYIKNGLTKTTTDANASVSTKIPANAWQFNFVYRTNTNGCDSRIEITQGVNYVEVFDGSHWVEAHNYQFSNLESAVTAMKGNTQYQKRLKMRCKNKAGGVNSIGTEKQITISKVSSTGRFNVVGFEWSPREFMLSVINGARGGHKWGDPTGNRLDQYQDLDIWAFNPDLLLAEITTINWGASEPTALTVDPLHYVNIAKRAYFNEFNDMPTSLHAKSEAYTKCDVIFYSDTLAASSAVSSAWDSTTYEPKFGTVTTAATNGAIVDTSNVGRVKTNFENYEAVEGYIASKDYLFIPVLSTFKSVAENYYGSYWAAMQPSDKTGTTLSYDGVHFNDNGAKLFASLICPIFENI